MKREALPYSESEALTLIGLYKSDKSRQNYAFQKLHGMLFYLLCPIVTQKFSFVLSKDKCLEFCDFESYFNMILLTCIQDYNPLLSQSFKNYFAAKLIYRTFDELEKTRSIRRTHTPNGTRRQVSPDIARSVSLSDLEDDNIHLACHNTEVAVDEKIRLDMLKSFIQLSNAYGIGSRRQRDILLMYLSGVPADKISKDFGMEKNCVQTTVYQVKVKLRRYFRDRQKVFT